MHFYERLIGFYPEDVQFAYGQEMLAELSREHNERRGQGFLRLAGFVGSRVASMLIDVVVERANNLYSHRSFHGRGKPNAGVVRPPNMGKKEWFDAALGRQPTDQNWNRAAKR